MPNLAQIAPNLKSYFLLLYFYILYVFKVDYCTIIANISHVLWINDTDEIMKTYSWSQTVVNPLLFLSGILVCYEIFNVWNMSVVKKMRRCFTNHLVEEKEIGKDC